MIVGDLASIEYNVVGHLARCPAIIETIRAKKDPYINFAPTLFPGRGYTYEGLLAEYKLFEETKGAQGRDDFRQFSKPPILGGGFGLGGGDEYVNSFGDTVRGGLWGYALNVCGVDMPRELAHQAVAAYRELNTEVVQLWTDMEQAFKDCLKSGDSFTVGKDTYDKFNREWNDAGLNITDAYITFSVVKSKALGKIMRMQLPSGRYLHYLNCRIVREIVKGKNGKEDWMSDQIYYDGVEHSAVEEGGKVSKGAVKWGQTKTYGGKLTENAVQAFARDLLWYGARLARDMGFNIYGTFHDEIAALVNNRKPGAPGIEDLLWCMRQSPWWASKMILGAAGWEGYYYKKG